mgnify:CR=1 FL=1
MCMAKRKRKMKIYEELVERGYNITSIAGTSIGSLIGGVYACGALPQFKEWLYSLDAWKVFTLMDLSISKNHFVKGDKIISAMKEVVPDINIEDLPIPMRVVSSDLDNGVVKVFTEGSLPERVMASSTVPIVFPPTVIDGVHYVDGGVFCNFPVEAIRKECEIVIGINVSPLAPTEYKKNVIEIALRAFNFMFRANSKESGKLCDILVEMPTVLQYETFSLNQVHEIYKLGYEETKKILQQHSHLLA